MKKRTEIIISFMLILAVFFVAVPVQAEETNSTTLKLENQEITAMVGSSFNVTLFIDNNPGIMGFDIVVEYDKNYIEPVEVSAGTVFKDEMLNDSIDTSLTNSFHVMWSGTDNITDNGELFTIKFNLKKNSETGNTKISFKTVSEDTYNESYDSVNIGDTTLNVKTTTDVIIKKQPVIAVYMEDWTVGEKASKPILVGNVENGEVTYEYSDSYDGVYSKDVPTQVGKYYLRAAVAETNNYQSCIATCTFKILEKSSAGGSKPTDGSGTTKKPSKGTVLKDNKNKISYKVISQGKTAAFYKLNNKKAEKVVIPAVVNINGIKYKVTAISDSAFSGCKKLKSVTIGKSVAAIGNNAFYKCIFISKIIIPSNVLKIGKRAFYGCKNLKSVIINSKKLKSKSVGTQAFKGINKKAIIKVPKKQKKAYQKWLKKKGITKKTKIK